MDCSCPNPLKISWPSLTVSTYSTFSVCCWETNFSDWIDQSVYMENENQKHSQICLSWKQQFPDFLILSTNWNRCCSWSEKARENCWWDFYLIFIQVGKLFKFDDIKIINGWRTHQRNRWEVENFKIECLFRDLTTASGISKHLHRWTKEHSRSTIVPRLLVCWTSQFLLFLIALLLLPLRIGQQHPRVELINAKIRMRMGSMEWNKIEARIPNDSMMWIFILHMIRILFYNNIKPLSSFDVCCSSFNSPRTRTSWIINDPTLCPQDDAQ